MIYKKNILLLLSLFHYIIITLYLYNLFLYNIFKKI